MLTTLTIHRARMEAAANDPAILATDVAEYLVGKGVPFREAHELVGKLVVRAAEMGVALDRLPAKQMQEISSVFGDDVYSAFDRQASLAKRSAEGAPAPKNIAARI